MSIIDSICFTLLYFPSYNSGFCSFNENNTALTASCTCLILTHTGCYFTVHKQLWYSWTIRLPGWRRQTRDWLADASIFSWHSECRCPCSFFNAQLPAAARLSVCLRVWTEKGKRIISSCFNHCCFRLLCAFGPFILTPWFIITLLVMCLWITNTQHTSFFEKLHIFM